MDHIVKLFTLLTIAGLVGLVLHNAGGVGKLAKGLVEILRRMVGVANA